MFTQISNEQLDIDMITGHRGAALLAPENTIISIERAAQAGAKWIEIDTQLTADKIPVVIHDETVDRCTDGEGKLSDLTLDEIKKLDAGSWFDSEFVGTTIPTLEEAMLKCMELGVTLNLELKVYNQHSTQALTDEVLATVERINYPLGKLLFSSFNQDVLAQCKTHYPEVRRGFICDKWDQQSLNNLLSLELYSIHIDHQLLDISIANEIKESGIILKIWTLNEPSKAIGFYEMGVDNIITDMPNQF